MKSYSSPRTEIIENRCSYMLMQSVSGGGMRGVAPYTGDPIVIH